MKKYFSKIFAVLLVVAMLASQVLLPVAALNDINCTCDPATRTGTLKDTVAATCADYGYEVYECNECQGTYTKLIAEPTGNHDYVDHAAQAPTCTEIGWNAYRTCSTCDFTEYVELPAIGHSYDAVVTAPTCTEKGFTTHTCINCSDTYKDTYVDALGHNPGAPVEENRNNAACENAGSYDTVTYCTECGAETSRVTTPIPAPGHNPGAPVIENRIDPDCENAGSYDTVTYCTECGAETSREHTVVDALGHDWQETGRVESTNCTVDGSIDYECSRCYETKQEAIPCIGQHDYETSIIGATCDTAEFVRHTCKVATCGYVLDEPVSEPLGHDEVIDAAVAPTCTETGLTEGKHCSRCPVVIVAQQTVPALGHDYVATVTAPTCSAQGYTTYECSRCDDSYVSDYVAIDPLSHRGIVTKVAVEATCTETGLTHEISCGDCGIILAAQRTTPKDPDNHNYTSVVTAPTCTVDGYTTHTCSRCNDTYTDSVVAALGHTDGTPVIENEVAADCVNGGQYDTVVYCAVCGEELSRITTPVAALGHTIVNVDAQAPTCTEIGWDAYEYCSVCTYTTYVEKDALGHDYQAVVTAPTCTGEGYTTHTCSRCFDSYIDTFVDATGHNDCETLGVVEPKCTEQGYTIKKCLVCHEVFKDPNLFVDALGHDEIAHDAQAPTCTAIGWDAYVTCSRCDYTTYVEKAALGHRLERYVELKPTCTESGYTDHIECARCDYTTLYFVTAPLGHDYVSVVTDPTCTEDGYTTHTCSRCSDTYTDGETDALGHTLTQHAAQAPTCTEIGWDAYEDCSECDYTTYVEKAAWGHRLEKYLAKPATCTEAGYTAHMECAFCDYTTLYAIIPATGHTEVIDAAVAATYDETGLTEGKHCSVCNEVLVAQTIVDRLQEEVTFTYEATGINGTNTAVNSGFVTVKVYMNVNSDIARIYGLNLDLKYNTNLSLVSVNGCIFKQANSTPAEIADLTHTVMLTQDMGYDTAKTFEKGEHLLATLTFKVNKEFHSQDVAFEVVAANCNIARDFLNEMVADFGTGTAIHVAMLGDANNDGVINSTDSMALSKWFADADIDAYDTIYDMNKDGFIDGDDFALLRGAIVRDNAYLDI